MSKYADIEQIKKTIREEWIKYIPMEFDMNIAFVLGKIAEVPTIEVVRCKDCFHYTQRTEHTGICDFWNAGVAFKDFCSMANQEPMLERIEE